MSVCRQAILITLAYSLVFSIFSFVYIASVSAAPKSFSPEDVKPNRIDTREQWNKECLYSEFKIERDEVSTDEYMFSKTGVTECFQQFMEECDSDGIASSDRTDDCLARKIFESIPGNECEFSDVNDCDTGGSVHGYLTNLCGLVGIDQIPADTVACDRVVVGFYCPVSLLWTPEADIESSLSFSRFALDPGMEGSWFTWKASADAPLLVYDPKHKGVIEDGRQLFGNWTFGGQATAMGSSRSSSSAAVQPKPWENGYQALAMLDLNGDSKLSGEELAPIGLWFDKNKDGISQKGEVKTLEEVQVVALYVTPDKKDEATGNLYASVGFERIVNGEKVVGSSVDWSGERYNSQLEGLNDLGARAMLSAEPEQSSGSFEYGRMADSNDALMFHESTNLSGAWLWEINGENSAYKPVGLLTLQDQGENITGHSYIEMPLKRSIGSVTHRFSFLPVSGVKEITENGRVNLEFEISNKTGYKTRTRAHLSKDGRQIRGVSHVSLKRPGSKDGITKLTYKWTAKRMTSQ